MIAKFYKLKISPQNRFYNKAAYEAYLTDANVLFTYTYKNDIIPDQPFYINRNTLENAKLLYNATYVTYDINGLMYGAFITEAQSLAPNGKQYRLNQVVDWWYFALFNEYDMHFHGSCERAHVNDIDQETKLPTLTNTVPVAECPVSNFNRSVSVVNLTALNGVSVAGKVDKNFTFLYIFFNKLSEVEIEGTNRQQIYYDSLDNIYMSQGFTYVFLLDKITGYVYPIDGYSGRMFLTDITNGNVVSMYITDAFAVAKSNYNLTYNSASKSYQMNFLNGEEYRWAVNSHTYTKNDGSLPKRLSYLIDKQYQGAVSSAAAFRAKIFVDQFDLTFRSINPAKPIVKYNTYDQYKQTALIKQFSNTYVEVGLNDNVIDTFKLNMNEANNDTPIYISLVPDLSSFIVSFGRARKSPAYNNQEFIVNNKSMFKPDTVQDYWTRLNAKQTGISAKQIRVGAINSIVQGVSKTLAAPAKIAENVASGNIAGAVGEAASGIGAIGGLATTSVQAGYSFEQADIIQEIADKQMRDGNVNSDSQVGVYLQQSVYSGIYLVYYYPSLYSPLQIDLHRYGYNTFLQLDDIYEHHQREHFNYFKAADIEVTGVPQFIADDIENMFKRGVHLWTRDIEEFENGTNYQLGLWEDTNV